MIEWLIVICIGAIAVLLIRKYPSGGSGAKLFSKKRQAKRYIMPSFKRVFARKKHVEESQIIEAIVADQENIVSPKDIEAAKENYDAEDPALAKLLFEINEAINSNDYAAAEEKAIEAISQDKHCDMAYAFIAYVALKRGELENAKTAAETALKCSASNAMSYAVLGELYLVKEKYSEAIDNLLKAVMLDRNVASWYGLLGQAYLEVRQYAKSAKAFKRASGLDIDNREYRRLASIAEEKQMSHSHVFRSK
ncbi:MAG: Tetratricopeptide repeat protein [bacterium ADurb.Bin212]|nr:MAG: Tetratricopeptide repeat protein [bacterium ADurb.Bin212]